MGDKPVCELPTRVNCDSEGRGRGREEGGKREREGEGRGRGREEGGKREGRGREEGKEGKRERKGRGRKREEAKEGKREGEGGENMVVHALLSIDLTLTFGSHSKIV